MPSTIDLVLPDRIQRDLFMRYVQDMLNARGIKTIAGATIFDTAGAMIGRLLLANQIDKSRAVQILAGTSIKAE
jgi:hypothetical protein